MERSVPRRTVASERKRQRLDKEREEEMKVEEERLLKEQERQRRKKQKLEEQRREAEKQRLEAERVRGEHEAAKQAWEEGRRGLRECRDAVKRWKRRQEEVYKELDRSAKYAEERQAQASGGAEDDDLADAMVEVAGSREHLPLPEGVLGWALCAWECANSLNEMLGMAKFTIDFLGNALKSSEDSVLLIELGRRLLRCALKDSDVEVLGDEALGTETQPDGENDENDENDGENGDESPVYRNRAAKKKRRSTMGLVAGEAVTPQNWEQVLARAISGLCAKLFAKVDDDDEDAGLCALARHAVRGQAALLGFGDGEEKPRGGDDDDDDEDDDGMEAPPPPPPPPARKKRARFRELDLEAKTAILAILALGALSTSGASSVMDERKERQEIAARNRKDQLRDAKNKAKDEQAALREACVVELRAEKKTTDDDDAGAGSRAENASLLPKEDAAAQGGGEDKDPTASQAAAAGVHVQKEPSPAEISKRVELKKDALILQQRVVLSVPPALDKIDPDEDESELEARLEAEETRLGQADVRKDLQLVKKRNVERRNARDRAADVMDERKDVLRRLAEIAPALGHPATGSSTALADELRTLILRAKEALLVGSAGECGQPRPWCVSQLADAFRHLSKIEKREEAEKEAAEFRAVLHAFGVRREPVGRDRFGRVYWHFDDANLPGRSKAKLPRVFRQTFASVDANLEGTLDQDDDHPNGGVGPTLSSSSPSPPLSSQTPRWEVFASKKALAALADGLAESHSLERDLKYRLRAGFDLEDPSAHPALTTESRDGDNDENPTPGEKKNFDELTTEPPEVEWRVDGEGAKYVGRLVLYRINRTFTEGLVVGWLPADDEDPDLWHCELSNGKDLDLEENELLQALVDHDVAHRKYVNIKTSKGTFLSDYLGGGALNTIKKGLSDRGYSNAQILDYLNNLD